MRVAVHAPRVNNNDDSVRVARVLASVGTAVRSGAPVAEVVTDKASFTIDAPADGLVLEVCAEEDQIVDVGSVLLWIGEGLGDEPRRDDDRREASTPAVPTLKAQVLLDAHGLEASAITPSGARLTVADVEAYVARRGANGKSSQPAASRTPASPGRYVTLTPEERAMLRTVAWHHAESVAGYVELHADPAPWLHYADAFQSAHGLLFSPLLSLMAWQVAQFARAQPRLNSVIVGERRYAYDDVNLGFTVQTESTLYLVVIRQADTLSPYDFCEQVTDLQRRATRNDLSEADVTGATIAFTSMARWNVTRHVPVLPPLTSIAIAHSAPRGQDLVLGATYDHRGLNGGDVAAALEQIARIPEPA